MKTLVKKKLGKMTNPSPWPFFAFSSSGFYSALEAVHTGTESEERGEGLLDYPVLPLGTLFSIVPPAKRSGHGATQSVEPRSRSRSQS